MSEPLVQPTGPIYNTRFSDGDTEIVLKLTGEEYAVMHRWLEKRKKESWDEGYTAGWDAWADSTMKYINGITTAIEYERGRKSE
jgi:hypothetical protein